MLAQLEVPNVYAILNGDLIESVVRTSKGELYKQVGSPQDQRDWIINKLKPYKGKYLGCTQGNHEARIDGVDISSDIATALECPYGQSGILLKISFGNNCHRVETQPYTYLVYATHGYGGARTSGAKMQKLKRQSSFLHSHVHFQSHDHEEMVGVDSYLMPDNRAAQGTGKAWSVGRVSEFNKKLVKTGSFIKWGGYAQAGGHPQTQLGTPLVIFSGEGKPWVNVWI